MESSRILIIGGTGYIGRHLTKASLAQGHPTFLLVRESTSPNPEKAELLDSFKSSGAAILHCYMIDRVWNLLLNTSLLNNIFVYEHPCTGIYRGLCKPCSGIKKVDVIISAVSTELMAEQFNLILAIKEIGTIKKFFPSDFGIDIDTQHASEQTRSIYDVREKIRRTIEAEGIPYKYVIAICFAGFFLPNLAQVGLTSPPKDKLVIYGDGNKKAVYVKEEDVGTFTIKSVDDPRALNKNLYLAPPANTLSFNELVTLWETKIGKTLEKEYLSEEQVLKLMEETPPPMKFFFLFFHSLYVKGDQINFKIGPDNVEASQLYPDVKYTTVDEYLNSFV